MSLWLLVLAPLFMLLIYVFLARLIAKFKIAPPAEPNPEDVRPVNYRYRCTVCGAEVTMTQAPTDEPEAPRHCREDMILIAGAPSGS